MPRLDAVVVGAGPNGLAAAIELARAGHSVTVLEAASTAGGGVRSAELTEPGFVHDVCSAIHPLLLASPFFQSLDLAALGVEIVQPPAPFAHPLDGGRAVVVERSVAETARGLGADGAPYTRLFGPLVPRARSLAGQFLGPFKLPRHPFVTASFGLRALRSATGLARRFEGEEARAVIAGIAAHSMLPLTTPSTGGYALMLGLLAHAVGWPLVRGGSQKIAEALTTELEALGGRIETERLVTSMDELPDASAYLFDLTPRQLLAIAGDRLAGRYRRALTRYRYGPGVCKVDLALDGPIPWANPEIRRAGTVHLGGTFEEIAASEAAANRGEHHDRPYVLLAQQSLFDSSRAPDGRHTVWAYAHVPHGSERDVSGAIEAQVERFAPGFRDRIIARHVFHAAGLERYNANYVGGDINGGAQDLRQLFTRPAVRFNPYSTPAEGIFLCSSATPPGGGVHGMCGHYAARSADRYLARSRRAAP